MSPFSILGIEYELGEEKVEISEIFENSKRIISRTGIECVYKTNRSVLLNRYSNIHHQQNTNEIR